MQVVILAAGYGNRMGEMTSNKSKHMLKVKEKPILEWNIEFIKNELQIYDIIIVTGYKEDIIKNYFGDGVNFGVKIKYVTQNLKTEKGLASAVSVVRKYVSKNFIVLLGDNIYKGNFYDIIDRHTQFKANTTVVIENNSKPERYGVVELDPIEKNKVIRLEEKPKNPKSNFVIIGFYIFDETIFEAIDNTNISKRGEYELTDAINLQCVNQKRKVKAIHIRGKRIDIGYKEDLITAEGWLKD